MTFQCMICGLNVIVFEMLPYLIASRTLLLPLHKKCNLYICKTSQLIRFLNSLERNKCDQLRVKLFLYRNMYTCNKVYIHKVLGTFYYVMKKSCNNKFVYLYICCLLFMYCCATLVGETHQNVT